MGRVLAAGSPRLWMLFSTVLLAAVLWVSAAHAMCPPQCFCHDDTLTAACPGARLTVFPIQLNPDVKHIDLSHNKIASVDYTLTFYINLVHLDLSYNKIQTLNSHNFERQENLTFLNISFNEISRLGKGTFKGLKLLKLLDIRNNSIETVEGTAFKDTVELEVLNLSNNKIIYFEDPLVFKNLRKLKYLYIDGNQIVDVPSQVLQNLPYSSIDLLSLSNNYIDQLEEGSFPSPVIGSLRQLILSSNAISNIHRSAFNSLHSLANLDLSDNNLTFIPTEQMSKLSQLTELNLSDNMFAEVPAVAFQSLFHLKILHLSRMPRLARIDSRAFVDNIHLESVIMDDNRNVTALPARVFHGNLHLRHVSVRRNSLSVIDASHFPVDSLKSLDVSGNPLFCNCSLLWLWKLAVQEQKSSELETNETLQDEGALRLSISELRCDQPPGLKGMLLVEVPDSAVRCDVTWMTVAAVSASVLGLFIATCLVLLLLGGDRPALPCRRSKHPPDVPERRPPNLTSGPGPPPVLMLMPDKQRYMEPWVSVNHNDYSLDMTSSVRKPAHVVYV